MKLCKTKNRYHIGGKNQYVAILIAIAFKIDGYEKLNGNNSMYTASYKDGNKTNINIENIYISEKGREIRNYKLYPKNRELQDVDGVEYKKVKIIPNYKIYKNGEIVSDVNRIQLFNENSGYYILNYKNKKQYKVHRLICFAFNPLPDLKNFEDYKHLQVNHKDGNTLNNNDDNLEWTTPSQNIQHAHDTNLIKVKRRVEQYSKDNVLLNTFKSVAEASRESGEPEHRIRNKNSRNIYIWKFNK